MALPLDEGRIQLEFQYGGFLVTSSDQRVQGGGKSEGHRPGTASVLHVLHQPFAPVLGDGRKTRRLSHPRRDAARRRARVERGGSERAQWERPLARGQQGATFAVGVTFLCQNCPSVLQHGCQTHPPSPAGCRNLPPPPSSSMIRWRPDKKVKRPTDSRGLF